MHLPSKSTRRRFHKRLRALAMLPEARRTEEANRLLAGWSVEVRRRARYLSAPAAWAFVHDPMIQAAAQLADPSGELYSDLCRIRAAAVARAAARPLLHGGHHHAHRS